MSKLAKTYSTIAGKVGSTKVKMIFFLITLVLFVLGSGAPESGGGIIERIWFIRLGF